MHGEQLAASQFRRVGATHRSQRFARRWVSPNLRRAKRQLWDEAEQVARSPQVDGKIKPFVVASSVCAWSCESDKECFEGHAGIEGAAAFDVEIGALQGSRQPINAGGAEVCVLLSGFLDCERRDSSELAGFIDVEPCGSQVSGVVQLQAG